MSDEAQVLEEAARSLIDRAVERFATAAAALRFDEAERCARVALATALLQEGELDAS